MLFVTMCFYFLFEIPSPGKQYKYECFRYRNAAEVEYIRRATTTEKKNYILDMIKYISKQLEISQKASTWMDSADQEFAIKRLHDIQTSIGWTDIVFNTTEYEKMSGFDKVC